MGGGVPKIQTFEKFGRRNVRFVPEAEVALIGSVELIVQPDAKDGVAEMGVRGDLTGPQP
jgi:hypothetical protein